MEAKNIYLVETGNGPAGAEGVRFVSVDHQKAVDFAKKFAQQINRKEKRARFPYPPLKKKLLSGDEGVFGEKITERWSNNVRDVQIIEYALDKEYNPVGIR